MEKIAPDLYLISGFPKYAINMYLMGDVLLDAGTRNSGKLILRELSGHDVKAHALTHVHPDHQGSSREICKELNIPLWCGKKDEFAMETGKWGPEQIPNNWKTQFFIRLWAGPQYFVSRGLREGDEVGGFTVIETPGHTPGHVAYWRESDRVLIAGDVLRNMNMFSTREQLSEAPEMFTPDPARNRESARKLAALRPELICFGHGRPLRDGKKFVKFVESLPK